MHTITINKITGKFEVEPINKTKITQKLGLKILKVSRKVDRRIRERRIRLAKKNLYNALKELQALGQIDGQRITRQSMISVAPGSDQLKAIAINGKADLKSVPQIAKVC